VFDNLDDVEVLDGFLPDVARDKHTLIAARNPNCYQIPAEGLEIGNLEVDDATDLLLTRSNVHPIPPVKDEAIRIVNEWGCIPLAVEQTAAYIRKTLKDIFEYLSSYRRSQKSHHERVSKANRTYYKNSIATTWGLSFKQLSRDASDLLRLITLLNLDGILADFLEAGKRGLSDQLRGAVDNSDWFFEALSELERFSLIGQQDDTADGQLITIYRSVQSVVREMSEQSFADRERHCFIRSPFL
jgi:hypothetical protein